MSALQSKPFAKGNDLSFGITIPPTIDPATGVLTAYPGLTITGFLSEASAPDTPLNGTILTFARQGPGRFVWLFGASDVDACLAAMSPLVLGAAFYAVATGAGEFKVYRRLRYELRVVP